MALKTAATSFVVSALLGSPQAGEAFTPFSMYEVRMVSTTMPSHGMGTGATSIPTSGSTSGEGAGRVSCNQKRSASSHTALSRFYGDSEDTDVRQEQDQQHPASSFYFADEGASTPPPAAQLSSTHARRGQLPPPAPPEPRGGGGGGGGGGKAAFQSAYNRPWRKRARDARRDTVFENTEAFGWEDLGDGGSGDAMRQRASEKEKVVASRKKMQKKAMNRAALPIVDLVGIVSPLVIILGMTIVHKVP